MTVGRLLAAATAELTAGGVPSPRHDAEALLAHVLGSASTLLCLAGPPTPDQATRFTALVARRAGREPLQHLLGRAPFRYVEVEVGPGVFTPRPETELLAGWAVGRLATLAAAGELPPVAVDLCTGSGAVAAALADEVPEATVHAVELSGDAIRYAERNLAGSGVHLHHADIADCLPELDGHVDVVVANPPYIPLSEYESVDVEARTHDPALALWSVGDGLDMVRVVEAVARRLLRPGGQVGCEHAEAQGSSALAVFSATGHWRDVRDHRDLLDRPRFVTAATA